MPNFHLADDEAAHLAAYIASAGEVPTPGEAKAGDPARGKALVASSGCVNCHNVPGVATAAKAPPFASIEAQGWARGCLDPAEAEGRKAPDFRLTEGQAGAVRALASVGLASLGRDADPEFAERQIKGLRCIACHKRDGYDDAWTDLKVETDTLLVGAPAEERDPDGLPYPADQVRPSLTWTGEKLRPEWSAAFIAGRVAYKPRPYLKARMPAFATRAEGLARGLALEHGFPPASPPDAEPDPTLVPVAQQLVRNSGLNCVSCHNIGKVAAVGVFEAPGINFRHVKERLRAPLLRPLGPCPDPGRARDQDAHLFQRRRLGPALDPRRQGRRPDRRPLELPAPGRRHRPARPVIEGPGRSLAVAPAPSDERPETSGGTP